jgi:The  BURPS668_1122 family of deaminases
VAVEIWKAYQTGRLRNSIDFHLTKCPPKPNHPRKLLSKDKTQGNFGLAQVNIPGLAKQEFFASSRVDDLSNSTIRERLPNISVKPTNEIFPWSSIPNASGFVVDRNIDSEYKILTEIAQLLGENINVSGTIKLFTERDMCASCANVVGLFKSIYKNINIEVIHNNGNIITP